MKRWPVWILLMIIFFILIIDLYTFKGIRLLLKEQNIEKSKMVIFSIHWLISLFFISAFIWIFLSFPPSKDPTIFRNYRCIHSISYHPLRDAFWKEQRPNETGQHPLSRSPRHF